MDLCFALRTQTTKWTRRRHDLTPLTGSRRRSIDYFLATVRGTESTIDRRRAAFGTPSRVKVIPELVKRRTLSLPDDTDFTLTPMKSVAPSNTYRLNSSLVLPSPLHQRYRLLHPKPHFPSSPRQRLRTVLKGHKAVLNVLKRSKVRTVSEATCTDL